LLTPPTPTASADQMNEENLHVIDRRLMSSSLYEEPQMLSNSNSLHSRSGSITNNNINRKSVTMETQPTIEETL